MYIYSCFRRNLDIADTVTVIEPVLTKHLA
jgi:hypothetical protein